MTESIFEGEGPQELAEIANQERLPTLKEKLSKVAEHCAYVRKDGVNLFHQYNYATASTIFQRVNEAMIENRLVSSPKFTVVESKELTNAKGNREHMVMVECNLFIADLDSGEHIRTIALGSGQDHGDKAVMKAQTAALKYAWMMLLNISTGDDPEDDAKVDARMTGEPITKRKTAEEIAATVEANKNATYSPEAIRLSNEINKTLAGGGTDAAGSKGSGWPGEKVASPSAESCPCGSPLMLKVTQKNGVKQSSYFCQLSELAYAYNWKSGKGRSTTDEERSAAVLMQNLDQSGEFPAEAHTKFKKAT